ncbi:hypothetical protein C7444_10136 [Sphaerotilus hippei]|uniref:Uncharacterized protein n=1 Tax=Sphaerotilus hippei TaxID=744406 RepID=A0A318H5G7_9BURK|nr:hypothetical protein [Sphaerotilus hippei]PXW99207.1 hypothetical protein C7444_10136 [Sphaerotilus hippei]
MATRWNRSFLNRAIAPGIADLTACDIPDLEHWPAEAEGWLRNDVLSGVHAAAFTGHARQHAITLLHRAQATVSQYHQARRSTLDFLRLSTPHDPSTPLYYAAITQWESCLINLQVFTDTAARFHGRRSFLPNDGSAAFRAHAIGNVIRAWGSPALRTELHDDEVMPLWLSNTGVHTRTLRLTYLELFRVVEDAAIVAHRIQHPHAAGSRLKA